MRIPFWIRHTRNLSNVWSSACGYRGIRGASMTRSWRNKGRFAQHPVASVEYGLGTMFPIFAKGMETDDSESEEIADWNEQPCGMGSSDSDSKDVVPRTYTPPLQRKRGRKYASLRKHETDVEDYFSDSSAEEDWIDECRYWWNRC